MKRPPRDLLLMLAVLALFTGVAVLSGLQQARTSRPQLPPLVSFSTQPDGAKALRLWLEELGYTVDPHLDSPTPPEGVDVAFVLQPRGKITSKQRRDWQQWVADGGVWVLAGTTTQVGEIAASIDWGQKPLDAPINAPALPQSPVWTSPPLKPITAFIPYAWVSGGLSSVTHLAVNGNPVVVSYWPFFGDGQVILVATAEPFTNEGLADEANAALVLNIMNQMPPGATVWFDEWHHGFGGPALTGGLGQWLRGTAAGRGVLLALAVLALAVALRGRRFGPPIPAPTHAARRTPLDYLTAAAHLSRRAGHRRAALRHYHDSLKRRLGERYRLDPTLPDEHYVAELLSYRPTLDAAGLRSLLQRLNQAQVSEHELVTLAAEAARWRSD